MSGEIVPIGSSSRTSTRDSVPRATCARTPADNNAALLSNDPATNSRRPMDFISILTFQLSSVNQKPISRSFLKGYAVVWEGLSTALRGPLHGDRARLFSEAEPENMIIVQEQPR